MGKIRIRPYKPEDETQVVDLWLTCGLVVPQNNPKRDIARKMKVNPELFLVGILDNTVVASCMAGYEGHRGWINYLAVAPKCRHRGFATELIKAAEYRLREMGCPKINVQIRATNYKAIEFYKRIGFSDDHVLSMAKRLEQDAPDDVE